MLIELCHVEWFLTKNALNVLSWHIHWQLLLLEWSVWTVDHFYARVIVRVERSILGWVLGCICCRLRWVLYRDLVLIWKVAWLALIYIGYGLSWVRGFGLEIFCLSQRLVTYLTLDDLWIVIIFLHGIKWIYVLHLTIIMRLKTVINRLGINLLRFMMVQKRLVNEPSRRCNNFGSSQTDISILKIDFDFKVKNMFLLPKRVGRVLHFFKFANI